MITQQKDENLLEYQARLCSNKDEYDLSWDDIRDLLNKASGENFGSDKYRKEWQAAIKFRDILSPLSTTDDIEVKKQELYKERVKLQDQRRELNNLLREQARFEHLHEEIMKSVQELGEVKPLSFNVDIKPIPNIDNRQAIIVLSDWHKGLFARNYWNNFDDSVFYTRVEYLVEKTIEYGIVNGVETLHVFSLGDLVNGLIHITTKILSTEDVIKQTMSVAETLAYAITEFANVFPQVKLYFCRGNHDRVTPNKSDEITSESFADVVRWYLTARLNNLKNVEFIDNIFDDEIVYANVFGFNVMGVHGHRDKTTDVAQNLTMMTGVKPDYIIMGHIHKNAEDEVHYSEVIVNGSLCGVDSYAKDIRKTSKPHQKLIIFDKEVGRLSTYNIRLDRIS